MASRKSHGGKGDRPRTADKERYDGNFDQAFPNAFVPSWKRRKLEAEQAAKDASEASSAQ